MSEILLKIDGLEIKKGTIYRVGGKRDNNSPEYLQDLNTSKFPSDTCANSIQADFVDPNGTGQGFWDTGLYIDSPRLSSYTDTIKKEFVDLVQKNVVEPYEKLHGKGCLNQNNNEFWDNYLVEVYEGKFFDTNKPSDLLGLIVAVVSRELEPINVDPDKKPLYRQAQFIVEDRYEQQDIKVRRKDRKALALRNYFGLSASNPKKLSQLVKYIGLFNTNLKVDSTAAERAFMDYLDKSYDNVDQWLTTYDKLNDKKGSEVLNTFDLLSKAVTKKVLTREMGTYYYQDEALGATLKDATNRFVNDKNLSDMKKEIIEKVG